MQPFLVSELLPGQIIPALYTTVELKLERIVDLGPFKHKVHTFCLTAVPSAKRSCYIHPPPVVLIIVCWHYLVVGGFMIGWGDARL